MTLQQQVQQHLQNTGISLRELAKQAAIGKSTVALVASGRSNPSLATRRKLQAAIRDYKPQTLDATVEKLAAQCIDSDLTHVCDTDLECAKYRRVMRLEQQLNDANTAYLSSKSQHERDLQRLNDANTEIKRLTALSETHAASWKAACVRSEQLQRQLDHGQAQFASLHEAYNQQVDDEREMLAQIDTLFAERANMRTEYEYSLMRLRVRCFALVCAIVLLIVSGLVVWGGV